MVGLVLVSNQQLAIPLPTVQSSNTVQLLKEFFREFSIPHPGPTQHGLAFPINLVH